jgi:cellulose biosynthesis protein BcsQ
MQHVHFDEAKRLAVARAKRWLSESAADARVLLLVDLSGHLRLMIWSAVDYSDLATDLDRNCGPWWTGEILNINQADTVIRDVGDAAWEDASRDSENPQFALLDRHRSRTAWFTSLVPPMWSAPETGPPIVVFYSFKGGLGRSTLLASFAIQRAQAGDRVCVLDLDLDSPGVGALLSADPEGLIARWGVVDFLLESSFNLPLGEYYHRCDRVAGTGEISVFPAGRLDEEYADKLARVDFEEAAASGFILTLLDRIRVDLRPHWILLDARTGISDSAAQLLSGIAHLYVLLGTTHNQSWQGLNLLLDRFGRDRVLVDEPQIEVVLVQAMVPIGEAGRLSRAAFAGRAEAEFADRYYAPVGEPGVSDDRLWDIGDLDSGDAPHVPLPLDYEARLASFGDIAEIADALCAEPYAVAAERIASRFRIESET